MSRCTCDPMSMDDMCPIHAGKSGSCTQCEEKQRRIEELERCAECAACSGKGCPVCGESGAASHDSNNLIHDQALGAVANALGLDDLFDKSPADTSRAICKAVEEQQREIERLQEAQGRQWQHGHDQGKAFAQSQRDEAEKEVGRLTLNAAAAGARTATMTGLRGECEAAFRIMDPDQPCRVSLSARVSEVVSQRDEAVEQRNAMTLAAIHADPASEGGLRHDDVPEVIEKLGKKLAAYQRGAWEDQESHQEEFRVWFANLKDMRSQRDEAVALLRAFQERTPCRFYPGGCEPPHRRVEGLKVAVCLGCDARALLSKLDQPTEGTHGD